MPHSAQIGGNQLELVQRARQCLPWLGDFWQSASGLVQALAGVVQQLRAADWLRDGSQRPTRAMQAYETRWLTLVLELGDVRGRRAVLTRTQRDEGNSLRLTTEKANARKGGE